MEKVPGFRRRYPAKEERESALRVMTGGQIDELFRDSGIVRAKIYCSQFKKHPVAPLGNDALKHT